MRDVLHRDWRFPFGHLLRGRCIVGRPKNKASKTSDFPDGVTLIIHPETMGKVLGLAASPLYSISAKGYFNFSIQMVLLIGCLRIMKGWGGGFVSVDLFAYCAPPASVFFFFLRRPRTCNQKQC